MRINSLTIAAIALAAAVSLSPLSPLAADIRTPDVPFVTPPVQATAEVSEVPAPAKGSGLAISGMTCERDTAENIIVAWKTNSVPPVKAKIVFWSTNQPNIEDRSLVEEAVATGTEHKFTVKAADVPKAFFKIRVSYAISEDSGTFFDVLTSGVKPAAQPASVQK